MQSSGLSGNPDFLFLLDSREIRILQDFQTNRKSGHPDFRDVRKIQNSEFLGFADIEDMDCPDVLEIWKSRFPENLELRILSDFRKQSELRTFKFSGNR